MSAIARQTALYDVERLRAEIWRHAYGRIPADILTRALLKSNELIDAKKTVFFAYEGKVRDSREVADNATQLKAANSVLEFAGAKVREQAATPSPPLTRLRYDPTSGLVEVIVGSPDQLSALESSPPTLALPALPPVTMREAEAAPETTPTPGGIVPLVPEVESESPKTDWLKVKLRDGKITPEIRAMLFGDDEGDGSENGEGTS